MARRTPRSGSTGPASSMAAAARSTSAVVTVPAGPLAPDHRKVDAELSGKRAHRRRRLDAPGLSPTFRRPLGRPLLLAWDGAHHGAAVGLFAPPRTRPAARR